MPNENLYDDGPAEATMPEGSMHKENMERTRETEGKTALINSEICPGMKAGDEMVLRIDRVLDSGEYEVSYAPEPEDKEEHGGSEHEMAGSSAKGGNPMSDSMYD